MVSRYIGKNTTIHIRVKELLVHTDGIGENMLVPINMVIDIIKYLKPGGYALIIDPGYEFQSLVSTIYPNSRQKTTGGKGFSQSEDIDVASIRDVKMIAWGDNKYFTTILPAMLGLKMISPVLMMNIGRLFLELDLKSRNPSRYSLHRWMFLKRLS